MIDATTVLMALSRGLLAMAWLLATGVSGGIGAESWMTIVKPVMAASVLSIAAIVEPIPAEAPIRGPFWTVVLPAALFMISFLATFLLYRCFAAETAGPTDDRESD
jgi:hypothetical protein